MSQWIQNLKVKTAMAAFFCSVFGVSVWAAHNHSHGSDKQAACSHELLNEGVANASLLIRIFGSGRDNDIQPEIRRRTEAITRASILLGLPQPSSNITTLNSADMAALSSVAGHAAPHWHDGRQILNGTRRAAGIYEFVMPGQPLHNQYIRDTNDLNETTVVLEHVIGGHYPFAMATSLWRRSNPDQIRSSYSLATNMSQLLAQGGTFTVSQYYQYLLSTDLLQDIFNGYYEAPDSFNPQQNNNQRSIQFQMQQGHPQQPTRSILQALVQNIPASVPQWKKDMLMRYEQRMNALPGYILQKFMNEGWATFVEYLLSAYLPEDMRVDPVSFAELQSGVRRPGLSNPYWLGSEIWMLLYNSFKNRAEIKGLPPLERDQRFVREVWYPVVQGEVDETFIRRHLSADWVRSKNLLLYKDKGLSFDFNTGQRIRVKQAITRDPQRIIDYIVNKVANLRFSIPEIKLVHLNHEGSGVARLRHVPYMDLPLQPAQAVKTLYVLSQILEVPISIETIGSKLWQLAEAMPRGRMGAIFPQRADFYEGPQSFPMVLTVTPAGKISVTVADEHKNKLPDDFEHMLQQAVDSYKEDVTLSLPEAIGGGDPRLLSLFSAALTDDNSPLLANAIQELSNHAPTASQAILEAIKTGKHRLNRYLKLIAQGKKKFSFSKRGVKVPVYPEVPHFEHDRWAMRTRQNLLPQTQPDWHPRTNPGPGQTLANLMGLPQQQSQSAFSRSLVTALPDEDLDIGVGPYLPGETWTEPVPPPGQGGDGDGDPEDGDGDGDEPGEPGQGPGNGGHDGEEVIPIDTFVDALLHNIELPNLRPTRTGDIEKQDEMRLGGEHGHPGEILPERTAQDAYQRGIAVAQAQGKDPDKMSFEDLIELGFQHMAPHEYTIASHDPEPEPDIEAIVVWVADTSGSMGPEERKLMRRMMMIELKALEKAYGKGKVKETFVIYDTQAEVVNRKDFFTKYKGGGTDAGPAIELVMQELRQKYPRARFNQFVRHFSDGDDGGNRTMALAEQLGHGVDFLGYTHVSVWGTSPDAYVGHILSDGFKQLHDKMPQKVGFSVLTRNTSSYIDTLKAMWGKRVR